MESFKNEKKNMESIRPRQANDENEVRERNKKRSKRQRVMSEREHKSINRRYDGRAAKRR